MNTNRNAKNVQKTTSSNPDGATSPDGGVNNVNVRPVTKDELAYRNGYIQGHDANENSQYQRERAAEGNGLASGILLGGIAALGIGLGIFVWNYANQDASSNRQPQSTTPIAVPASPKPNTTPAAQNKQTTVIERTIEKAAPPPEVKIIEVPKPVPVAPSSVPSAPASQSSTTSSSTSQPPASQPPASQLSTGQSSSAQPANRQPSSNPPSGSQPSDNQSVPGATSGSGNGN